MKADFRELPRTLPLCSYRFLVDLLAIGMKWCVHMLVCVWWWGGGCRCWRGLEEWSDCCPLFSEGQLKLLANP